MSFLNNYNSLVEILLCPTELLGPNKDMASFISILLNKKETLDLFFR